MARAYGQRLKLRLFLEGVEIPIIAAQIQTSPNAPMMAAIQIPPLAEGTKLLPRTTVHLFFLDFYESFNPFVTEGGAAKPSSASPDPTEGEQQNAPTPEETAEVINNAAVDSNNARYKLLFGGEIVGFQWTKQVAQRSLVLQCEDWSNYWDYAYQWNNTGIFGPGAKAVFSGGGTTIFTDFLSSKGSTITSIVSQGRCNTFPKLKGLAAGIVRLIEAIGGVYHPRASGGLLGVKRAGQNAFFSLAELRLHITQMVSALENDSTSLTLLNRRGYESMFERALGGLGGQVSIRKSINALTQIIFHEMYAQPCPKFVPGSDQTSSGKRRRKIKDDDTTNFLATGVEGIIDTLDKVRDNIDTAINDPESEQAANPKQTMRTSAQQLATCIQRLNKLIVRSRPAFKGRSGLDQVTKSLSAARSALGVARAQVLKGVFKGLDTARVSFTKIGEADDQLAKIPNLTIQSTGKEDIEPARLQQHIFRPDIWFAAPPRCNILFPDEYIQFDYQRQFLKEPTRFMLKVNDEFFGPDELFDTFYFAPQAGTQSGNRDRANDMRRGALLDHELFTGILPVFEKMGEFNLFASRSGASGGGGTNKVGFAQRSANFIYFKHRFNARQARVVSKFNPYIACGFPGLVIDKYVDPATIQLWNDLKKKLVAGQGKADSPYQNKYNESDLPPQELGGMLGTNFLGNFTQVTHMVSQEQMMGRTDIIMSYPRQPDESVEFLGTTEPVQTVRKRFEKNAVRSMDVAALFPPRILSLGPNGGQITNVVDVTQQYAPTGRAAPLFTGARPTEVSRKQPVFVPIGVLVTGQATGSEDITRAAGSADRPVRFRAYKITEEVPRYRREEVDLPAEEFIRPGWYGDVWSSPKIGQAYDSFLSTGSITDPQNITDPTGATRTVPSQENENAVVEKDQANAVDDPRAEAPIVTALDQGSSIQDAVEFLLLTYSYIRQQNLDVDQFIRAYTWRPIATMIDLFGTGDLEFNSEGNVAVAGREGFHSRAFGPYGDLNGLLGPDEQDTIGIKRGTVMAQKLDTRARKLQAVQRLAGALRFSRAILG